MQVTSRDHSIYLLSLMMHAISLPLLCKKYQQIWENLLICMFVGYTFDVDTN